MRVDTKNEFLADNKILFSNLFFSLDIGIVKNSLKITWKVNIITV
jgi:hypothetical protein